MASSARRRRPHTCCTTVGITCACHAAAAGGKILRPHATPVEMADPRPRRQRPRPVDRRGGGEQRWMLGDLCAALRCTVPPRRSSIGSRRIQRSACRPDCSQPSDSSSIGQPAWPAGQIEKHKLHILDVRRQENQRWRPGRPPRCRRSYPHGKGSCRCGRSSVRRLSMGVEMVHDDGQRILIAEAARLGDQRQPIVRTTPLTLPHTLPGAISSCS